MLLGKITIRLEWKGFNNFFTIKNVGLICWFHLCRRIIVALLPCAVLAVMHWFQQREEYIHFHTKRSGSYYQISTGNIFFKECSINIFFLPLKTGWNLMLWWKAYFLKSKCYLLFLWHLALFYWIRHRSWKIPGSFSCLDKY